MRYANLFHAMIFSAVIAAPTDRLSAQSAATKPGQTRAANPARNSAPAAATTRPSQPTVPSPGQLLGMIRSTIEGLDQANATGNYYVFHALASAAFRRTNSAISIAQAFEPFRRGGISLRPALIIGPELMKPPLLEDGQLHLAGYFPTQPERIIFDLKYIQEGGAWRVSGLNVNLSPSAERAAPDARRETVTR